MVHTAFPVIAYNEWVRMGRFVQLTDGTLFYVHKGRGFPLVLMHHIGGNSWWWSRTLDTLAQQYSVYALDLPGFGQSETPELAYDVPDFAAAVREFMDAVGIERAHLFGNSGGSLIGVQLATSAPERVGKLVLDYLPHWNRAGAKKLWRNMFQRYLDKKGQLRPFEQWRTRGDTFETLDEETGRVAFERMAQDFREHAEWFMTVLKVGALRYDVNTRLNLINAPTLLVVGETASEHTRQGQEKLVEAIRGARLAIVPRAGNRCPFEQPEFYVQLVLDFLGEST